MTDATATDAPIDDAATATAPVLARPRGRRRRRDEPEPRRRRARPPALPRLPDRRPRRARHLSGHRQPAVDRRLGPEAPPPDRPDPAGGDDRPARPAGHDQADGRAADRRLGVGRDPGPALAADHRARPRADLVLAVRAGRVRPVARRARSRSSPTRRSTWSRGSCTSSTASGRMPARPGRSMRTSSSAPSTASTPRRSRPGSSPRPARTSPRRSRPRSGR